MVSCRLLNISKNFLNYLYYVCASEGCGVPLRITNVIFIFSEESFNVELVIRMNTSTIITIVVSDILNIVPFKSLLVIFLVANYASICLWLAHNSL